MLCKSIVIKFNFRCALASFGIILGCIPVTNGGKESLVLRAVTEIGAQLWTRQGQKTLAGRPDPVVVSLFGTNYMYSCPHTVGIDGKMMTFQSVKLDSEKKRTPSPNPITVRNSIIGKALSHLLPAHPTTEEKVTEQPFTDQQEFTNSQKMYLREYLWQGTLVDLQKYITGDGSACVISRALAASILVNFEENHGNEGGIKVNVLLNNKFDEELKLGDNEIGTSIEEVD